MVMEHLVAQWGAVVVGLLAAGSIVIGARIALIRTPDGRPSTSLTRIFAFGTGAFFTAVCLDFLPDAWSAAAASTPLWVFLGAFCLWLATNASDGWFHRQSATDPTERHPQATHAKGAQSDKALRFTPVSGLVLAVALSFHTFLEGGAVALAFHHVTGATLGFSLAVILHKLPEGVLWGMALLAVFPSERLRIRRMLMVPAVSTLVGVGLGIWLGNLASSPTMNVATAFVAGAMLYIVFAELFPALRETAPGMTRLWFLVGLALMFILNMATTVFGG